MCYFTRITIILFFNLYLAFSYSQTQSAKSFNELDSLIIKREYKTAEKRAKQIINNTARDSLVAKANIYLGKINLFKGELDVALSNYMIAKKYLNTFNPKDRLELFSGIGVVYSKAKQYDNAEKSFKEALSGYRNNDFLRLKVLVNLGGVYMEQDNEKALSIYKKALNLSKTLKRPNIESVILTNLSNFYIKKSAWGPAIKMADKSLQKRDSLGMPLSVVTYNNMGYAMVNSGKINKGIAYYEKAIPQANKQELQQLFYNLKNAYLSLKDYKKGIYYFDRYDSVKELISEKKYNQNITKIKASYQNAEKERKIEFLEAENKLHKKEITGLVLGSAILFLFIAAIVFFRLKSLKVKQELKQSELRGKFLRLQLNPHFLFNALQQIQYYIFKNKRDKSIHYLDNFSKLIRLILEHSENDYIYLQDEIAILSNYLELQNSGTATKFRYQIKCENVRDPEAIKIPAMLLQPYVENAVIHGRSQNQGRGTVNILFKQLFKEQCLYIEIVDNGKGIKENEKENHKKLHRSMGQDILRNRMEEFNKMNKTRISLKIQNAYEDEKYPGTRVSLRVPYFSC